MSRNYKLSQQLVARILLISFFLQSCNNLTNQLIPIQGEETDHKQVAIKELVDKKLTSKEGHVVTFYEQAGQLQVEVKEEHGSLSRTHTLPVYIAADVNSAQVATLSETEQKRLVHVVLPKGDKPGSGYVYVGGIGLMGGGDKGGKKSQNQQKRKGKGKEKEDVKEGEEEDKIKKIVRSKSKKGQKKALEETIEADNISRIKSVEESSNDQIVIGMMASLSLEGKEKQEDEYEATDHISTEYSSMNISELAKLANTNDTKAQKEIIARCLKIGVSSFMKSLVDPFSWEGIQEKAKQDQEYVYILLYFSEQVKDHPIYANIVSSVKAHAQSGNLLAQTNLGYMYEKGIGVACDNKQALAWYTKAADQGNAEAQFKLGMISYKEDKDYVTAIKYFQKAAEYGEKYNLNTMLDKLLIEGLAKKCFLNKDTTSDAKKTFELLGEALDAKVIKLSIKNLQHIQKSLHNFCKEKKHNHGVTIIREFIKKIKSHVPRTRDYHEDSEGESDSEDHEIVYRALRTDEDPNIGLFAKGRDRNFGIKNHITPLKGHSNKNDSPWISTTRSLKVAAAWASESKHNKGIAKIKMDNAWREQECDHVEPGKRKIYDFTNQENINLFFPDKRDTRARNTAVSSQEVTIYREIPKENILALYTADTLSDKEYKDLNGKTREELANIGIYNIVKTRKKTKHEPIPRVIRIKGLEDYKVSRKVELAEGAVEIVIVNQEATSKKDKGKEKEIETDEKDYVESKKEEIRMDMLDRKILQLVRQVKKDDVMDLLEHQLLQLVRQAKQEAVIESMNCLISNEAPNGKLIIQKIREASECESKTLDFGTTSLKKQDFVLLSHHPFFKGICERVTFVNLDTAMSNSDIKALGQSLQNTKVQEIDLSENKLGDDAAVELAKNLQGTNVQKVNLRYNTISDKGVVKFICNLQGTNVNMVNLSNNDIGTGGAFGIAKNLQGTNLHTVDLSGSVLPDTQRLIKERYPHIKWIF